MEVSIEKLLNVTAPQMPIQLPSIGFLMPKSNKPQKASQGAPGGKMRSQAQKNRGSAIKPIAADARRKSS